VAFPDAECKIYLVASPQERARRRLRDLVERGESVELQQVLADQERRDREDAGRPVGPMKPAADATEVSTDGLSIEQVVDRLEAVVRAHM
jgi:cytidylate kinase